ncbi:hypothetical protein ZIOFF_023384 [Zingiber officinale]|uniref:Uncharacterized protein n=1 Tax=Zingiber officinale TaxID=94328 RepID=A0A8J5LFK9_ZINOF|nr:hypothetical protein ZIOFF_023384 [Zingiber officinale]
MEEKKGELRVVKRARREGQRRTAAVRRKVRRLRRLVPGGRELQPEQLFLQTAEYIYSYTDIPLQAQRKVFRYLGFYHVAAPLLVGFLRWHLASDIVRAEEKAKNVAFPSSPVSGKDRGDYETSKALSNTQECEPIATEIRDVSNDEVD